MYVPSHVLLYTCKHFSVSRWHCIVKMCIYFLFICRINNICGKWMNYHNSRATQCYRTPTYMNLYTFAWVRGFYMFIVRGFTFLFGFFFRSATFKCTFITFAQTNFYCQAKEIAQKHKTKLFTDFIVQDEQSLWTVDNVLFVHMLS